MLNFDDSAFGDEAVFSFMEESLAHPDFTVVSSKSIVGGEVWLAICKGFNTDQSRHCSQLKAQLFPTPWCYFGTHRP
jgi:hypothetical protein